MQHDLIQGSDAWHEFRLTHFGASEAAAMLGISTKVKRTELLHMKFTCLPKEFSDWVQANILDYGHEVEALARPHVENIIHDDLYPVTHSADLLPAGCKYHLSASLDGLTMCERTAFEHKQWNEALAESVANGVLPDEYQPQCQQIMLVTPAEKVIFVVSDGTPDRMVWMEVLPDTAWHARIIAGWEQFEKDLLTYEPKQFAEKPAAVAICALPALIANIRGEVVTTNLTAFKAAAAQFIGNIKTDLQTDEDFVNADATVRFCGEAEKDIERAKAAALAQTASIDDLMRTVDQIKEQLRNKRLSLEKLIESKKKSIKEAILADVKRKYAEHVTGLQAEIQTVTLTLAAPDFAGAMKNKRTLSSLHDAVDTLLASAKIAANELAAGVRGKVTWLKDNSVGYEDLFPDLQQLIGKAQDDFQLVVTTRIAEHKRKEDARIAAKAEADAKAAAAVAPVVAENVSLTAELRLAQASPEGAELSLAARAINEAEGAQRFATYHRTAAPATPPSLRLGQINDRIAPLSISVDGLRTLGFEPAARDKAAMLYHERDFASICAALIRHIGAIQAKAAA